MRKIEDLKNKKFKKLSVIDFVETRNNHSYWFCKCDCGNDVIVRADHLKDGSKISCGCLSKKNINTNNKRRINPRLYKCWEDMQRRCYRVKNNNYKYYGGRGIKVCNEWLIDFMNFYNWAINNGYKENLTIDRINVNGNYEPSNCKWATKSEQQHNTRRYKKKGLNNDRKSNEKETEA